MGALKNEFSWSRSRDRTFDGCRRRYWFSHYGHWGGWEDGADERTHATWVLKKLKTRHMWAGEVVHDAVRLALEVLRNGRAPDPKAAEEAAVETMRMQFRQSRDGRYWKDPKRFTGLIEHEYREAVPDERWKDLAEHVRNCIRAFFASELYGRFQALGPDDWLPVEERAHFFLDDVKIYVKPDAAFRDGGVAIVDWKTGRREDDPDPIQLACYALYALEEGWAERPEEITTIEYALAHGRGRERPMTAERAEGAREHIRKRIGMMRPLDGAPESEFAVTADPGDCRDCAFRKVCPDRPAACGGAP